jgi:hypothetical protein
MIQALGFVHGVLSLESLSTSHWLLLEFTLLGACGRWAQDFRDTVLCLTSYNTEIVCIPHMVTDSFTWWSNWTLAILHAFDALSSFVKTAHAKVSSLRSMTWLSVAILELQGALTCNSVGHGRHQDHVVRKTALSLSLRRIKAMLEVAWVHTLHLLHTLGCYWVDHDLGLSGYDLCLVKLDILLSVSTFVLLELGVSDGFLARWQGDVVAVAYWLLGEWWGKHPG